MKKKLLFIWICLLVIGNVRAQIVVTPLETDVQLRAGELPFGYCGESIDVRDGNDATMESSAAIHIPGYISGIYAGKKITKIRIGLGIVATNISVWIRNSLTGDNLVTQSVSDDNNWGWREVTLSTPFTLSTDDIYIGYSATGELPLGFSYTNYGGYWTLNSVGNWVNYNHWALCLQALIDPEEAKIYAAEFKSLDRTVTVSTGTLNTAISLQGIINNYSSETATNVKVSYQLNSQSPVEKTISTTIASMETAQIEIPITGIASAGIYHVSVKLLEINGQANALADKTMNSEIRVISNSFPRKVVMEEGTGTWCSWCIRGTVGLAMMKNKYPDTYIGIAVHNGDPMTVTAYNSYMEPIFNYSFPSSIINRKTDLLVDPLYGSEDAYLSEISQLPIAGIKLSGAFTDANKTAITLKTVTTFGFTANNANYRLAYVLLENGVTGYTQANAYAGGENGVMGGYESRPASITDMVFDDVARGIYSDPTGISGSIPIAVAEMTPIEHNYTITLPSSIKDKNKLEVVVMLINANTEELENADKIEVNSIVDNLHIAESDAVAVFILDGQLIVRTDIPVRSVEVYNITGQMVLSQKTSAKRIPVAHLNEGVYFVKIETSQGVQTFKVIK